LTSGEREQAERLKNKIRSTGRKLSEEDSKIINEADKADASISSLHSLREEVFQGVDDLILAKMKEIAPLISPVINTAAEQLTAKVISTVEERFSAIIDKDSLRRLHTSIMMGAKTPEVKSLEKIFVDLTGPEITLKVQESLLSVIEIASDYVYEKLQTSLLRVFDDLESDKEREKGEAQAAQEKEKKVSDGSPLQETPSSVGDKKSAKPLPVPGAEPLSTKPLPTPGAKPAKPTPAAKTPTKPATPNKDTKPKPVEDKKDKKDKKDDKKGKSKPTPPPKSGLKQGENALDVAPQSTAPTVNHVTKERASAPAGKRKPPSRRPRGPETAE